ncbi:MAG: D-lyxose/D-mannose family sugar isomerase [Kiritimatiellia bacterium]
MKRSEINCIFREATACFLRHGWALPPKPRWDITDFGLDDFEHFGLVLINLAEEPEYCEKLMYARKNQRTPAHTHRVKKEDIICRHGRLCLRLWQGCPDDADSAECFELNVNGEPRSHTNGDVLTLEAGERVCLVPGVYHEFWAGEDDTIIGEVSTANDDATDNVFVRGDIGRFPGIEEDEAPGVRLISEVCV